MSRDDLVGTWRRETSDGVPLAPELRDEWVLRHDGTATLGHLGPGTWAYSDGYLTAEPGYLRHAGSRLPAPPRYEVVQVSGDRLLLRYAPDGPTRQRLFSPAIRRFPPDAPGLSRASIEAGLIPWALDYPGGNTATVYLPDDGRGPDAVAEIIAVVERSLSAVMGFTKVA